MDLAALKEKVIAEVIRQLGEAPVSAAPAASAPAAPAAPVPAVPAESASHPLAEKHLACLVNPETAVPARVDVLVVLTGRDAVGDGLAEVRRLVQQGYRAALVTSPELLEATGAGLLYEVLQGGPAFCRGDEALAARLVRAAGCVLVPALSLPAAAQAAQLLAGDLAAAVLVHAILQGKPVLAARDAVAVPQGGRPVPFALRRRLEENLAALKGYGVVLTDAGKLAATAVQILGAPPAPAPAATPAPAPGGSPGPWDRELAALIDHTLLKPDATAAQIERLCQEAVRYGFCSVCINPTWVPLAAQRLQGTDVKVCTVIGFPLGATSTTAKALEARDAIGKGAREVDMVLNVGLLKSGQYDAVIADIRAVVEAARGQALVKVILETGLLTDAEKIKACALCREAGADFVKTATGFGPGGATVADVALLRRTVGPQMGVKASGGIRDRETALAMVQAGATRIGASASVAIVTGAAGRSGAGPGTY